MTKHKAKAPKGRVWQMVEIGGLGFSVIFELAAGPFVGFFIGSYLKTEMGFHESIVFLFIALGFVASLVNVVKTVKTMIRISSENQTPR